MPKNDDPHLNTAGIRRRDFIVASGAAVATAGHAGKAGLHPHLERGGGQRGNAVRRHRRGRQTLQGDAWRQDKDELRSRCGGWSSVSDSQCVGEITTLQSGSTRDCQN